MEAIKYLGDYGLAAVVVFILLYWVVPKLDRIMERLGDVQASLILLVTSLPEIKKRTKEEAQRLQERLENEGK